ncbi:MAG: tyrosine-protein phosphatase [Blastocatellales bacterium]
MINQDRLNGMLQGFSPISKFPAKVILLAVIAIAAIFSCVAVSMAHSIGNDKSDKSIVKSDISLVGVDNFGKVTEFFYRGAQPEEDEYQQLANIGIRTIIDLRNDPKEYSRPIAVKLGMKYINLPMSDKSYPAADTADKFLHLVNDSENWPVYVHCAGGRHRTGAMTAVFRMKIQGWNIDQAYEEMKHYDFYTRWGHKAMKTYVFDYYNGLLNSRNAELKESKNYQVTEGIQLQKQ